MDEVSSRGRLNVVQWICVEAFKTIINANHATMI